MLRVGLGFVLASIALVLCAPSEIRAHDGPPFPIVSDYTSGAYAVEVWTDPDTTDDETPGGQFWVLLEPVGDSRELPADTIVRVAIRPSGRDAEWIAARAEPVDGQLSRQFAALVMDHEGRFDVRVEIDGPLGPGKAEAWVDATYDLRPPPIMLVVYLLPFLAVGVLWMKVLLRRRQAGVRM